MYWCGKTPLDCVRRGLGDQVVGVVLTQPLREKSRLRVSTILLAAIVLQFRCRYWVFGPKGLTRGGTVENTGESMRRRGKTFFRKVVTGLAVTAATAGLLAVDLNAASAATRPFRADPVTTASNISPVKDVNADCPSGTRVIGGGGRASGPGSNTVRLTQLIPVFNTGANLFRVVAEAPNGVSAAAWQLTAYAICAAGLTDQNYKIVAKSVFAAKAQQETAVGCPSGMRAIGTGALAFADDQGKVGLFLNRTDGALGISRAIGHVGAAGYTKSWLLTTYAVCTTEYPQARYQDGFGPFQASATCRTGERALSAGSGTGLTPDGRPVFLRVVEPAADLHGVVVSGTNNEIVNLGVLATAVCST
jgi:hypothetical protein